MPSPSYPDAAFARLWSTLARLLAPDGCPWDREQCAPDLARHLVDEGHEWIEAADAGDAAGQAEELGDLAYLVCFGLMQLAEAEDVAPAAALDAIDAKLRRRHPQLFPAATADAGPDAAEIADAAAQKQLWERIKRAERRDKGQDSGLLKRLPPSLGALSKSHRYQEKAAGVGFDWPELAGVLAKLDEELGELRRELVDLPPQPDPSSATASPSAAYRRALAGRDRSRLRDELGDLFFVAVNLCRWLGLEAEEVAEGANAKFLRRFRGMERSLETSGRTLEEADLEEMESHWQGVKRGEGEPTD